MNGFGFLEYEDPLDAKDVVPGQYPILSNRALADNCQLFVRVV